MSDKLWIFDTTLRDGNQSPGCGMTIKEKLSLSKKLADLGVDIIEAGFPISSDAEFNAVKNIAKEYSKSGPIICGFGRANKLDIDRAWEAVKYAKNKRIHIGIGTSELHLKYKFHKTKDEILEIAAKTTAHASNYDCEVEFYAEDSTRSDLKYLCEVLKTVIDNGASIINLPDTTGFSYSSDYYNMINKVKQNISNIDKVVISTHCHDDYGLATINSLEGVRAGARQVECSILGIGERSGNASLEEIIANIEKRKDIFGELENNVNLKKLKPTAEYLANIINVDISMHKSIVGDNCFATEAGIHADGTLKNDKVYLSIDPKKFGLKEELVLGSRSGKATLIWKLEQLGYAVSNNNIDEFYSLFIENTDANIKRRSMPDKEFSELADKFGYIKN